jgi:hypothetical protein
MFFSPGTVDSIKHILNVFSSGTVDLIYHVLNIFSSGGRRRSMPAGSPDDSPGVSVRHAEQVRQAAVDHPAGKPQRRLPLQLGQRSKRPSHQVGEAFY